MEARQGRNRMRVRFTTARPCVARGRSAAPCALASFRNATESFGFAIIKTPESMGCSAEPAIERTPMLKQPPDPDVHRCGALRFGTYTLRWGTHYYLAEQIEL